MGCQAAAGGAAGRVRPRMTDDAGEGLAEWVRKERVDGVISAEPRHAERLRAAGWRVPEQVAYVCFTHAAEMTGVAGVANNPVAIAAAAVDMVVAQLHRNERGVPAEPRVLQISPRWVPGETCRAAGAE